VADRGAEDLDEEQVGQHALHQHPQEGGEDEVVQQRRHSQAAHVTLHALEAGKEDNPGQKHGHGEVDEHPLVSALPQLSVE